MRQLKVSVCMTLLFILTPLVAQETTLPAADQEKEHSKTYLKNNNIFLKSLKQREEKAEKESADEGGEG